MSILRLQTLASLLSIILFGFFLSTAPAHAKGTAHDAATMQCLGCHESGLKVDLVFHSEGSDHPIGMDYVRLAKGNPSLVRPAKLNPKLRLDHGRIGCLTCHVPYDKKNHLVLAKKRLAMPAGADPMLTLDNSVSGLCMACHLK